MQQEKTWAWLTQGTKIGAWDPLTLPSMNINGTATTVIGMPDISKIVQATNNMDILF